MKKIAIVAVGFNRVDSLSRLLDSLNVAEYDSSDVPLIISVDKSLTNEVEIFADSFCWRYGEKIVDKHETNLGLRNHMFSLKKWFERYDALVILEDDVVVAPGFYAFASEAVRHYYLDKKIAGIGLYSFSVNYQTFEPFVPYKKEYDVYFMNCAMSWGQVWMKEQWLEFYEWYLRHQEFPYSSLLPHAICEWPKSSWLKYHTRYCIEQDKYFVYPYSSYSTNCGDVGTHYKQKNTIYQVPLQGGCKKNFTFPLRDTDVVCYDGFFENKQIYSYLGLSEEDCCIELNGNNNNRQNKRYWLTTRQLHYKILKSYGLEFRPIELNVINENVGDCIFLYDTSVQKKNVFSTNIDVLLKYRYCFNNLVLFVRKIGFKSLLKDLVWLIKQKMK